jgi:protein-disulfide isomerase/uncharacterized membrane protein
MKKFIYTVMLLAVAGTILSGSLTIEHYYPDTGISSTLCKDSIINPCSSIQQSEYATILGIPVAAFGLLFYIFILFSVLIADYAAERYYLYFLAIALPLTAVSILIDIFLLIILIKLSVFCTLCMLTYLINVLLFIILILWIIKTKSTRNMSLRDVLRSILGFGQENPDRRATLSLFIIFIFFLSFAIFSSSYIMKIKTYEPSPSKEKIEAFINKFFLSPPADLNLPESKMILGNTNAPVSIVVFTDFLCSACYKFFRVEKYLFSKFQDKINVIYYNYPLDKSCNKYTSYTRYLNSCLASRAITAAAQLKSFEQYLIEHFSRYPAIARAYNMESSFEIADRVIDRSTFIEKFNSDETGEIVERDINIARELGIDATPTIYINGRKLVGVLPGKVIEAIIERELYQ